MTSSNPATTIAITTHNRKEHLRRTLTCATQQAGDHEILVITDGCTDGTQEMVRTEFPQVRLHISQERRGLIVQRNVAAQLASADYIVTLDDDVILPDPNMINYALSLFTDPAIAVISMPHVNHIGDVKRQFFPDVPPQPEIWLTRAYVGCANIIKRDVFLALGGYHEYLYHWGEETDFCLRLLNTGQVIRISDGILVEHHPAQVGRHTRARNIFLQRNSILNHWYNAPLRMLPIVFGREFVAALVRSFQSRSFMPLESMFRGYCAIAHEFRERKPVSWQTYRLHLQMCKKRIIPLDEVKDQIAVIASQK